MGNLKEKFNADEALKTINYDFPGYTPSEESLEFFNLMRLVYGQDFLVTTPTWHYFAIDVVFGKVKAEQFPYSKEVQSTINVDPHRIAVVASRGGAKSTLLTAFLPLYLAIKGGMPNGKKIPFITSVSASAQGGARVISKTLGSMVNESIFCQNYFEEIRTTETEIELVRKGPGSKADRTFLMRNVGWSGGIRGIRDSYGRRPSAFLLDDIIPSSAAAYSETIMDQLKTIVYSDILNALEAGTDNYVISVATPFTESDIVWSMLVGGVYTPMLFPICEHIDKDTKVKDIKSMWPAMHTPESILKQYQSAVQSGELQSFQQERMLQISSEAERLIPEYMLSWYDTRSLIVKNIQNFSIVITTDFTAGNTKKGDYSGIAVWAINANDDKYLIDLFLEQCTIQEQYEALFKLVSRWGSKGASLEVGIEIDGQQQLNINRLDAMMIEKNIWFRYARQKGKSPNQVGIRSKGQGNKMERLRGVLPDFELNKIKFPKELEDSPAMKEALEEIRKTSRSGVGCVSADTKVFTDKGLISIRDVRIGDNVVSQYQGYVANFKVTDVILTGIKDTYSIYTETGVMHLTAEHKVLTTTGYKKVCDLGVSDKLVTGDITWNKLNTVDTNGQEKSQGIINLQPRLERVGIGYTDTSINKLKGIYLKVWMFTTRTITRKITAQIILNYYHALLTKSITQTMKTGTTTTELQKNKKSYVNWLNKLKLGSMKVLGNVVQDLKEIRRGFVFGVKKSLHSKTQTKMVQNSAHHSAESVIEIKELIQTINLWVWKLVLYVVMNSSKRHQIKRLVQQSATNSMSTNEVGQNWKYESVWSVEQAMKSSKTVNESSAVKNVQKQIEVNRNMNIDVKNVEEPIIQKLMLNQDSAELGVVSVSIVKIVKRKRELVYDLSVDKANNFTVENGVVIHNSLHDDFLDCMSQLALIDYINPSNSAPNVDALPKVSGVWGEDFSEDDDDEDYNSSLIF